MSGVKLWMCISAMGLVGLWLTQWYARAHRDVHRHHVHEHSHGDTVHTHYHSHDEHDAHVPSPCGGDDHHCCMDEGEPDDAVHLLPPPDTRRIDSLARVALASATLEGSDGPAAALKPPRSPPSHPSSQDSLPHLRTIVLLT